MESETLQPHIQPTQSHMVETPHMHKERNRLIAVAAILIVLLGIGAAYVYKKNNQPRFNDLTPIEQLQALEKSSQPVKSTEAERAQDLEDLRKSSKPVTTSREERMNQLNALQ
jgi:hypothetical protein